MRAVDQWKQIEASLPDGWEEARLSYTVEDQAAAQAAAAALAPLGPGRSGRELRFHVHPSGPASAESLGNLLVRLDRKRVWGDLALVDVRALQGAPDRAAQGDETALEQHRTSLAEAWDAQLATVPPDWSDLLCELEVDSSDYLPRAALLGAPLNPTRNPDALALRFRASRRGYGVSASMARRCFERLDDNGITAAIRVLRVLSDADNVDTQGPVWLVGGKTL